MIAQANVDFIRGVFRARLGDEYVYSGVWSATDPGQGCDCSGLVGTVLEALTKGPAAMNWDHDVSTESWPFDYTTNTPAAPGTIGPYGTVAVASLDDIPADAALTINIMHGGGGEDSHTNCVLLGQIMESNGDAGTCTNGTGGAASTNPEWTDHWYLPGPIGTPMQGLDYAGGRPSGASIKAAGYSFVCRYLSDGGAGLPGKQLLASEADDLEANGIGIVANWETTGTTAQGGYNAGVADAQAAIAYATSVGMPSGRPIYFSVDWDTTEADQVAINAYFQGVASVIGIAATGIYGGFWPVSRALDAGVVTWAWQTQAWSGGNQDPRINILQNANAGYATVDGIQCDIDESLTADFGQWSTPTPNPPSPGDDVLTAQQVQDQYNWTMWTYAQLQGFNPAMVELSLPGCTPTPTGKGWPQLGQNPLGESLTVVDALADVKDNITLQPTQGKTT